MSATSDDYAISDSSYCSPSRGVLHGAGARATAPVGLLAQGLALAHAAGAGGGRYSCAGRVWRPTFVPLRDGAIAILGGSEDDCFGKPCLAAPDYRTRRLPQLPPGRVPGYRCVSVALCAGAGCCGDKLWSPCMRGPSTGRPLDEFAIDLSLVSTF